MFSKTALTTTAWLTIGVLAILVASLFNFGIYVGTLSKQPTRWHVSRDIMKAVVMSQSFDISHKHLFLLDGRGYTVKIANQAAPKSEILTRFGKKFLMHKLESEYPKGHYSVMLLNGRWLVRRESSAHDQWMIGFALVAILFLVMLVALCYWAIRRVSMPVRSFVAAAERFGRDIQAPSLLVQGNAEVRELQQSFNEMQSRIRRLVMDRTQMLAAISHDLRTPITRLQLRAEYLQGSDQYEKAVRDLDEIEQMIRSILSFARDYTANEVMESFDLSALLESIANDMIDTGKPVKYVSENSSQPFCGKVNALRRAINNLVENGIKYGNKVDLCLRAEESALVIEISDSGPGIPESEKDKVFAPFYRVDPSRSPQKSGTGLGLAVARDIIRAHGGEIDLRNRVVGSGLVVMVTLPTI